MYISVSDSIKLAVHDVSPKKKSTKTALVIVHGILEHGKNYDKLMLNIAKLDILAISFDLRGHGQSEAPRAYVERFEDYLDDLEAVLQHVKKQYSIEQVILLGHSMGGLIASLYTAERSTRIPELKIIRLLLSSPCFGFYLPISNWLQKPVSLLNILTPSWMISGLVNINKLTHDSAELKKIKADSLRQKKVSVRLLHEFSQQVMCSQKWVSKISIPTYIFQAGDDQLVSKHAVKNWYAQLVCPKEYTEYQGFYHEILNEVSQQKVINDITSCVKECV